jgi:hypothetical protein
MASVGRQKLLSKPVAPSLHKDYKAWEEEWEKPAKSRKLMVTCAREQDRSP